MGLKDKMNDATQQFQQLLAPHLRGEALQGVGNATRRKSAFKQELIVFGVTPTRLILLGADRRMQPTGEVIELTAADVVKSSVDGIGAGVGHFLGNSEGEIWIDTQQHGRIKLMVIGNGILERAMLGEAGVSGTTAMCEWLARVRGG
jgi:hypothetical protein